MIKANELRIGNVVQDEKSGALMFVTEISPKHIAAEVVDRDKYPLFHGWQMDGIPLTPEILEKCGFEKQSMSVSFEKHHTYYDYHTKETTYIFLFATYLYYGYWDEFGFIKESKPLQYVHELQNLYHALTGEELGVNTL